MIRRFISLGALVVAAACGGEEASDPSVVRADSAGVRLVTSTGPDRELEWRLEQLDVLRDSLGEPWLFTGIRPSRVITDRAGRTYVLEGEPAIRRFGRDGQYERSIGRKGGAPGEMQFPMALRQQGDTIAVLDVVRNVLVRWDPSFEPVNDLRLEGALADAADLAFRFGGVWVLKRDYTAQNLSSSFYLDTAAAEPLLRVEQKVPSMVRASCSGGTSVAVALPPFFSPDIYFDVAGARVLANAGPSYDVHLYEGSRAIARVSRTLPTRAPTAEDVAKLYPNGFNVGAGGASCAFDMELLLKEAGVAEQMPFIHGLALLSDGTMWVQRSVRNESPVILDVFSSDGAYAGTLSGYHLPVGLLPTGEYLFPHEDEDSGGLVIARTRIVK
jgi:hypothetical protein